MAGSDFNKVSEFVFWEKGSERFVANITEIRDLDSRDIRTFVCIAKWWFDAYGDRLWHPTRKQIFVPAEAWRALYSGPIPEQIEEVLQSKLNGAGANSITRSGNSGGSQEPFAFRKQGESNSASKSSSNDSGYGTGEEAIEKKKGRIGCGRAGTKRKIQSIQEEEDADGDGEGEASDAGRIAK